MYNIEQITNKSYADILSLYEMSFGFIDAMESVRNKYDTQRFGLRNIGNIAKSESNELAAYYGVFPITLSYNNTDLLVAQSGDTMTAPKHRKKGLFTRLAKETYRLSRENGIKMIFGFPNNNSLPGFQRKLDWEFHGFMQRFTFKINTLPLCELSSKFPILKPLYNRFVSNRIAKYNVSIDKVDFDKFNYSKVKGQIKKDRHFFEYKLNRKNTYVVSINGLQLLIKADTHLRVGAVSHITDDQSPLLIESIKTLAKRTGCKKAIFSLSKNHWLYNILTKERTPTISLPIGFYAIDKSLDLAEIQFSDADYDTF